MKFFRLIFLVSLLFHITNHLYGQSFYDYYVTKSKAWNVIGDLFSPPSHLENKLGNYRSPLRFYEGDTVLTKKDWSYRREEIRNRWMDMMGPWPEIITNQKFEIISTEKIEDFVQHKVRFYWTPNEQTEGYLLIPDRQGSKPAVISVFYEPET